MIVVLVYLRWINDYLYWCMGGKVMICYTDVWEMD